MSQRVNDKIQIEPEDLEAFERLFDARYTGLSWVDDGKVLEIFPLDQSTGLPTLPDGYFWRVGLLYLSPYISLMHQKEYDRLLYVTERWGPLNLFSRRREEFRKQSVERTLALYPVGSVYTDTRESLKTSAVHILSWLPRDLDAVFSESRTEKFYGDYHPQSDTMEG